MRPLLKNQTYSLLFTIFLASFLLLFLGICTNDNITANAQSKTPSSSLYHTTLPTIQIISPQEGEQVPPGELAIHGISSDNEDTDCRVYADVNDITPMQNVSAAGDSGEEDDFSKWSFTYAPKYQLIKQGDNELTAKITCLNERNSNADAFHLMSASAAPLNSSPSLSKWHTVNVTGVAGAPPVSQALPPASSTEGLVEEEDNEESNEEDIGIEEDIASEEDSSSEEEITNDEQNDDDVDNDEDDNNISDNSEGGNGDSFFSGDPFFD
ncbi:MAG TPA: hypothetical protein VGW09_04990 [Nitrososphaeraceae archaeon]|nr:hypothetical protein [Nitrososphaeraceae archaeon]